MRFLADENLEQPVVDALRAAQHDVLCVGDAAPGSTDDAVVELANTQQRILLTNDKDFGELVYRQGRVTAGVVLLRLQTEDGREKAAQLLRLLPTTESDLLGRFSVITEKRLRLRVLRHV